MKKIVRFEGIQEETADKDKNTPPRHQKQKRKKDKLRRIRRRQLRKQKIARQKMEEANEEMDELSWTGFVDCYSDRNADKKFREIVANSKNEDGGLEAAIADGREYDSLDDDEKDQFKALRTLLIKEGKCCFLYRQVLLARSRENLKIDGAEVDKDGTNDASSNASDSGALNQREVRIPPGMEKRGILDHPFTSVQIKQEMKEIMSSIVLEKEEKRKALEVWLYEVGHATTGIEFIQHFFEEFLTYVTGDDFNPNDIVEVFKSPQRNSAMDSVDGSSNGTVASDSTISSCKSSSGTGASDITLSSELAGLLPVNHGDTDNTNN